MAATETSVQLLDPWLVIAMLESTTSLNEKRAIILEEGRNRNNVFFRGLQWAFNSFWTFGVTRVSAATVDGPGLDWDTFESLLRALETKAYTGNAAIHAIEAHKLQSTADQWNFWYKCILEKNFRAGFTGKAINEYVKLGLLADKYRIDIFNCMLAHPSEKHERKMSGIKLVDQKLDGIRMLAQVHRQGNVKLYTREGKDLTEKFPKVVAELSLLSLDEDMMFDGELMSSSFKETMRTANTKSTNEFSDAVYHMFTAMPLGAFTRGYCEWGELSRRQYLLDLMATPSSNCQHIAALPFDVFDLDSPVEYQRYLAYNKAALKSGFEGVMIKVIDGPYECKRSTGWLKAKPFIEVTMRVTGMYGGLHKYTGMLGGLNCTGEYDGRTINVNVGSGFTDYERQTIWDMGDGVIDMLLEVRADAVSSNDDGGFSLRFPRFKTFRGEVPKELL
jgi:DNA ligase-1